MLVRPRADWPIQSLARGALVTARRRRLPLSHAEGEGSSGAMIAIASNPTLLMTRSRSFLHRNRHAERGPPCISDGSAPSRFGAARSSREMRRYLRMSARGEGRPRKFSGLKPFAAGPCASSGSHSVQEASSSCAILRLDRSRPSARSGCCRKIVTAGRLTPRRLAWNVYQR